MTRALLIAAALAAYVALLWLYADTHADIIAAPAEGAHDYGDPS